MGREESKVEDYLKDRVCLMEGITRKLVAQGRTGFPDRTCFFPLGRVLIIELKAKGEKPRKDQIEEMRLLRAQGQWVAWTDSKHGVDKILTDFEKCDIEAFNQWNPL